MAATDPSVTSRAKSLRRDLEAIVGPQYVLLGATGERRKNERRKKTRKEKPERRSPEDSSGFAIDGTVPATVVSPGSEQEIAEILRLASANDHVVVPAGGMTRRHLGAIPGRIDILLKTARLNKVLHYDAGDLTLGVGAGMTVAEVQKVLSANSQFLPLDPMLPDRATIGGVLAANSAGPMRHGLGSVRDYCIGIHFVTADGHMAKGGGKVVKNVAGYDLMKLMIGSMGTLGVITSANFKVFPVAKKSSTFLCQCSTAEEAINLRDRIIASPLAPLCLELLSPRALEYISADVQPRDPDHYAPTAGVRLAADWTLAVQAGGSDAVLKRYRSDLGSAASTELTNDAETDYWRRVSNIEDTLARRHRNLMVMQLTVAPASVHSALRAAGETAAEHNLLTVIAGRAAGSFLVAFVPMGVDPPNAMQFANAASSLRGKLAKDASAVVMQCPLESKRRFDVWGSSPNDMQLMRNIRETMDAKRILNRGRFIV